MVEINGCRYLDEAEFAELRGVKPMTLRVERSRRQGPTFSRMGRRVLYREDAVQAWLEMRAVKTRSAEAA